MGIDSALQMSVGSLPLNSMGEDQNLSECIFRLWNRKHIDVGRIPVNPSMQNQLQVPIQLKFILKLHQKQWDLNMKVSPFLNKNGFRYILKGKFLFFSFGQLEKISLWIWNIFLDQIGLNFKKSFKKNPEKEVLRVELNALFRLKQVCGVQESYAGKKKQWLYFKSA